MKEQQQFKRDKSDVRSLAAALCGFGSLKALVIEASVDQGLGVYNEPSSIREWHPVWIRAVEVYRTVTLAMARSSIAVEYFGIYKRSQRCSVPTWDVNAHMPSLESSNFSQAAQHIKSISLSVSTKVETDMQKVADARARLTGAELAYYEAGMGTQAGQLSENDSDAVSEENYPGVARLLTQMPHLEQLDLHLYGTLRGSVKSYAKIFTYIADDVRLLSLRS